MKAPHNTIPPISKERVIEIANNLGFPVVRFFAPQGKKRELENSFARSNHADGSLLPILEAAPTVLVTGLPFGTDSSDNVQPSVAGKIAPFARSFHYREATKRLQNAVREMCTTTMFSKQNFRIFCNSRFPEKTMGALSGLGFLGRNGLLINPTFGSRLVIAGILLPFYLESDPMISEPPPTYPSCAACRLCIDACPVGAISEESEQEGISPINRLLCLSDVSGRLQALSEEVANSLGDRIYGCSDCQDVCPYNSSLPYLDAVTRGRIGSSISIDVILKAGLQKPASLKELFTGTVLGQNYLDPAVFLRNALIIAGNNRASGLKELVGHYLTHPDNSISTAAIQAMEKIDHSEY